MQSDHDEIRDLIEGLLGRMGVEATVESEQVQEQPPVFNVRTNDSGILIGQRGAHLDAFQYLARVLSYKKLGKPVHFVIDVERYKRSREDFLRELARQAASRVQDTRERLLLKPMASYERRIVHTEISTFPGVITESLGEEPERRVVIRPS